MWTRANESMPWRTEQERAIENEIEIERSSYKKYRVRSCSRWWARTFRVHNDKIHQIKRWKSRVQTNKCVIIYRCDLAVPKSRLAMAFSAIERARKVMFVAEMCAPDTMPLFHNSLPVFCCNKLYLQRWFFHSLGVIYFVVIFIVIAIVSFESHLLSWATEARAHNIDVAT